MAPGEEPQASNLVVVLVHAMGVNGIVASNLSSSYTVVCNKTHRDYCNFIIMCSIMSATKSQTKEKKEGKRREEKGRKRKEKGGKREGKFKNFLAGSFGCSVVAGLLLNCCRGFCPLKLQRLQCPCS